MKINFPVLFNTSISRCKYFFIFGNDVTIFERTYFFLQNKFSLVPQELSESELLTSNFSQPSLFDDPSKRTLYLVPNVSDKILSKLEEFKKGIFIFTSLKARSQSKLVMHFTQSPDALAISAYASPITTSEFEFLVQGMRLPVSFKANLFKSYQNDYTGLLSTLDKIRLYGDVTEDQNEVFLKKQVSSDEFLPFIHAILLRDIKKSTELSPFLLAADIIPLLRTLMRSFLILLELIPFKEASKSIPWYSLKSSVFFKDQPVYETALSRWKPKEIYILLEKLLNLEKSVKYRFFQNSSVISTLFLEMKRSSL